MKNESLLSLRNVRDIVILIFFGVMSYKLFNIDLSLDIKGFEFTDLLSILVAFFAMALSVAFYFKATDTSNRFYDNSYAFTKDISEILGRMEAGFGEQLKSLDKGYTGINDKLASTFDPIKAKENIEKEQQEITEKEAELHKTLEELVKKAQLAEDEKSKFFEHMESLNSELEKSKSEIQKLHEEIRINEETEEIREGLQAKIYPLSIPGGSLSEGFKLANFKGKKRLKERK